ncbi:unnamed protein product [Candidula unifasciata]|uniref:C2H2-type domain-containing protein n=1 Tax=Candidula unifasciata TaxID=100452 RepID=A0A8S3YN53_9EUPU|nr:unnamed protein product [Candidula unifasciata]
MDHMEFSIALPPCVDFTKAGVEWADMKQRLNAHSRHSSDQHEGLVKAFLMSIAVEQVQEIFSMFGLTYDEAVKFSQILQRLEEACLPRFLIIYNRYRFFTCKQNLDDTFDDFLRDLINWSENCEFGDLKDILLKDCIITGVPDATIRQRLLETEELDFTKTIDICRAVEKQQKRQNTWIPTNQAGLADISVGSECLGLTADGRQVQPSVKVFNHASTNTDFDDFTVQISGEQTTNVKDIRSTMCHGIELDEAISSVELLDQSENVQKSGGDCSGQPYSVSGETNNFCLTATPVRELRRSKRLGQVANQLFDLNSDQKKRSSRDVNLNVCKTVSQLKTSADDGQGENNNSIECQISKLHLGVKKKFYDKGTVETSNEKHSELLTEIAASPKQTHKVMENGTLKFSRKTVESGNHQKNAVVKEEEDRSFLSKLSPALMQVKGSHERKNYRRQNLKCRMCQAAFSDLAALRKHRLKHKQERKFKCDFCLSKFTNLSHLKVHTRLHTGERPYTCDTCGALYSEASKLKAHLRKHTGEKPYRCTVCSRMFAWTAAYTRHMRTHTGERPYTCEFCGVCFADFTSLQRHIRTHTLEKPYQCNKCSSKFTDPSALKLHNRIHNGERPYACSTCGVTFIRSQHLKEHIKLHTGEKPFRCETCGANFAEASKLKSHSRKHTGEKPYLCKMCGTRFAWTAAFTRHMRTHTLEKPYVCDFCGSHFADHSTLTRHRRTHTGERPYPCKICGSGFADNSSLHRHMRIHTGEKSYTCEVCGSSFAVKSYLVRHMRTHTGEKPYTCDLCGSKFTDSSKLNRHKKVHLKDQMKWGNQVKPEAHKIQQIQPVQPLQMLLPDGTVHHPSTNGNLDSGSADYQRSLIPLVHALQLPVVMTPALLPLSKPLPCNSSLLS